MSSCYIQNTYASRAYRRTYVNNVPTISSVYTFIEAIEGASIDGVRNDRVNSQYGDVSTRRSLSSPFIDTGLDQVNIR